MISIGFFSEMNLSSHDDGSIKDYLTDEIEYDKKTVIKYLNSFEHFASCPKTAIDCVTGEPISPSFMIFNDGEYCWADFLAYHVEKYNIKLSSDFINHVLERS